MNSFFLRLWSGVIGAWRSLFLTVAISLASASLFVWIGVLLWEKLPISMIIFLLAGMALNAWILISLLRSAIRAIAGWHARKIEAVGGVVAIVSLVAVVYYGAGYLALSK